MRYMCLKTSKRQRRNVNRLDGLVRLARVYLFRQAPLNGFIEHNMAEKSSQSLSMSSKYYVMPIKDDVWSFD